MKLVTKQSLALLFAATALGLSACSNSNQNSGKPSNNKNANSKIIKHKSSSSSNTKPGTLSADQIGPKENVSIITIYAARKYGNGWQKVLDNAKDSSLNASLESRSSASGDYRGQGYIYQVSAGKSSSDTCYTISGDGSSQIIYLYQGDKYLGSSTVGEIVDYLNKLNCDDEVKSLMNNVQIGTQSNDDQDSDGDDSGSGRKKSNVPGDEGVFTTPTDIRGTWYGTEIKELTIGAHTISGNGSGTTQLHKQDPNFSDKDKLSSASARHAKDFGAANMRNLDGFNFMVVAGWTQIDGSRGMYAAHTENGQPVLLIVSSGGGLQEILWKTPQLAHKYAHTKFSDLKKLGGIMSE
ncbi:hypothetical protein [uncultured Lactobacillus sp.]|uniref:hypothetical protein n=1 Tax=uncultured Lactobacillus sp. TaxID=153152 RepID=UPI002805774A|nr:hypothetical protein [uncultured Lactobacillus sp.]